MTTNIETRFNVLDLSDSDWSILSNRWARGIDWCVRQLGRHWTVGETFACLFDPRPGGWPLWQTRDAAFDALTARVLHESRRRAQARAGTMTRTEMAAASWGNPDCEVNFDPTGARWLWTGRLFERAGT